MTARRVGLHRNRWHQYAFGNSPWEPGVTTILRVQDAIDGPERLIQYNINRVLEKIAQGGTEEEARAYASYARDRGTHVHSGIEAMIRDDGYEPDVSDGRIWYAWGNFLMREKPEIIATERMVFNPKAGYGGTLDLDAEIRGKRALIDVKTGKLKPTHVLQLAGLSAPDCFWGEPDDPERHPIPEYEAYYVLLLNDDGYELVPLAVEESEVNHFLYLAETYHRLKAWDRRDVSLQEAA